MTRKRWFEQALVGLGGGRLSRVKQSESLSFKKDYVSLKPHGCRAKKTPTAPTPILENFSRVCVNYNGVTKPTPCNLNGIGVASRHRIIRGNIFTGPEGPGGIRW
jgi:hypothetical protein